MGKLSPRIKAIKKEVTCREHKREWLRKREEELRRSSPAEREVLDVWDNSDYIRGQIVKRTDERNWAIGKSNDEWEAIRMIRECVRKRMSTGRVIMSIHMYFACCEKGGQLWGGENHGFKNACGLLKRLAADGLESAWWEAKVSKLAASGFADQDEGWTKTVADEFAKYVMHLAHWPMLTNPSKDYEAFMKAGMRTRWFAEEYRVPGDCMLGFVWDTLNRELDSRNWRPEPKILLREELWDSWLPVCLMEMSLVPKGE